MGMRIEHAKQLPKEGALCAETRERGDLDFKTFADPRTAWEHAKDVAALANGLGGALIVGAAEDPNGGIAYPGIHGQSAKDVQTIYEGAARLCSPPPDVDPIALGLDSGQVVVAINVEPSVDTVIAAPVRTRDARGDWTRHEQGWFFPRRVGSQTEPILPAELPMYLNRDARRGFLLIQRIPVPSRNEMTVFHAAWRGGTYGAIEYKDRELDLAGTVPDRNVVEFNVRGGQQEVLRVPLMDILDVWEHAHGKWSVRIAGMIGERPGNQFGPMLRYVPMWR